ncbi:MAG TPA: RNA-binding protein [Chromatiales bacterium]|nr:RNA-binding protein [Chromatiales bacterium]
MEIFVRNIPSSSTRHELKQFIQRGLWRLLPIGAKPRIDSCSILKITDQNGLSEYHGLVEVQPDKAARTAIRRLNGKVFKGRVVELRPYYKRSGGGRRTEKGERAFDRRMAERRRSNLKMEKKIVAKVSVPYDEE